MGTKASRDKGISQFVEEYLEKEGLQLFENWHAHLKRLNPEKEKITDEEVRDEMLAEIVASVSEGNSLILSKKDKQMVEELLNRFLKRSDLLK